MLHLIVNTSYTSKWLNVNMKSYESLDVVQHERCCLAARPAPALLQHVAARHGKNCDSSYSAFRQPGNFTAHFLFFQLIQGATVVVSVRIGSSLKPNHQMPF